MSAFVFSFSVEYVRWWEKKEQVGNCSMRRKCEDHSGDRIDQEKAAVKRTVEVGTFLLSLHVLVRRRHGETRRGKGAAPGDLTMYPNNLLNMDRASA